MNELAMGFGQQNQGQAQGQSPWATVNGKSSSNGTGIADVASSFVFEAPKTNNPNDDFMSQFGSMSVNTSTGQASNANTNSSTSPTNQFSFNNAFGSSGSQPQSQSQSTTEFLQPQQTGFGGSSVKPFKPTSSFGSQLLDGLAPVSASPATSPGMGASPQAASGGIQNQMTGFPGMGQQGTGGQQNQNQNQFGAFGGMGQQSTGAGGAGQQNQFGAGAFGGMGSQSTGQGMANPFRQNTGGGGGGMGNLAFGQGGAFGASSPFAGQNNPSQQGQGQGGFGQQGGSLI
jgi:hypothetical protein